jgi:hypothetical protein
MAIIACEAGRRVDVHGTRPDQTVRSKMGPSDLLRSVHAIGIASQSMYARQSAESDRERKQKFDVPATTTAAAHRHSGFSTREKNARGLNRIAVDRDRMRNSGHNFRDFARLAFDTGVDEIAASNILRMKLLTG